MAQQGRRDSPEQLCHMASKEVILSQPEVKLSVQHHQNYGPLQPKPATNVCVAEKVGEAQLCLCEHPPQLTKTG